MQKIEVIGLTVTDLQKMMEETVERAIEKTQGKTIASDYEEITLEEAAKELRCSKATIRRRMTELNIAGCRLGREIVIQRRDLKKIRKGA